MKLYQELARLINAIENCRKANNLDWLNKHLERFDALVKEHMPHGSGFDCGTSFDEDNSTPNRLVFHASFHHMNNNGYYDGWTSHSIIVTPDLGFGFDLRVTGCNRRDIKDYIAETFHETLDRDLEPTKGVKP
jgi:hypothetical protein